MKRHLISLCVSVVLLWGCSATEPVQSKIPQVSEGVFDSIDTVNIYGGLLITSEHFSDNYVRKLFTDEYSETTYYPLPAGLSEELVDFEKRMYTVMMSNRTFDDYNMHVWYNYYNTRLADYFEITDPAEILALNIDLTEHHDSHSPYDHGKPSSHLWSGFDTPSSTDDAVERAKVDAGIVDFNMFYSY